MVRPLLAQLSRESFVYGLAAAASRLAGLLLVPLYAKLLQPAEYGLLNALTTTTGVIGSLLILGLDTGATLSFYKTEDPDERKAILSTFLGFELVLTALACAGLFAAAEPIAGILSSLDASDAGALSGGSYTGYVQLAVATIPFATFVVLFLDAARLSRLPLRYLVISVGNLLLTAALIFAFVALLRLGINGVLLGTLIGSAIFSFAGWRLVAFQYRVVFSRAILRRLLALGLPVVPAIAALWVINFSNRWFLLPISAEQVAILAFATALSAPVVLIVTAFQIAWVPFSMSFARNAAAEQVYARTLPYFLAVAFTVLLLLTLGSTPLIILLGTPEYLPAAGILPLVGLSSIAYGAYYIVATGVNLVGRTAHLGWTTVVAAAVSIALNLLLIPYLGVVGAAVTSVVANLVPVILLYRVAQRLHRIPYELPRIALLALAGVAAVALAAVLPRAEPLWDLLLRTGLMIGFLALLVPIGVIRPRDLREAWRIVRRR